MSKSITSIYVSAKNHLDLMLCFLCVVFFLLFPHLDILISDFFYQEDFYLNENPVVHITYKIFAKIHVLFLLLLLGLSVYYSIHKHFIHRRKSLYLLAALLLGPGILVNAVLKDNSVGRPRPVHIQEFGGTRDYAPVFHYSGQCEKNCSFVSGHASIGFYMMSLYWVFRRKPWLYAGIGLGAFVGLGRIVQGGHFFSDVIFAGWVVYFTCKYLAFFIKPTPLKSA